MYVLCMHKTHNGWPQVGPGLFAALLHLPTVVTPVAVVEKQHSVEGNLDKPDKITGQSRWGRLENTVKTRDRKFEKVPQKQTN